MNLQQIIERLAVYGCELTVYGDTIVTERGDTYLHSGIKKEGNEWLIYTMNRGYVTEDKRFSELDDACFTFFMQCISSLSFETKFNPYIFVEPNVLEAKIRTELELFLEKVAYPRNLYTFDKDSGQKNCFYFESTSDIGFNVYYIGNDFIIFLYDNKWSITPYELWSLETMLKEEQVLLEKGYIKERLTDREMADFILGRY